MMKKFLPGALGALMVLASCSQNEVAEINRDGDEIRFNVVTNKATKAADVYCNNNMMTEFYVSAITDGKTYIANDEIKHENNSWVNQAGTRYWPETAVDFYAHVNAGTTFSCEKESENEDAGFVAKFTNFQPSTTVANQVDLLYAVKTGQKKNADGETANPVELNFRHALSQIVFEARNESENIHVEIAGVKVVNVDGQGTFTFPSTSTDGKVVDHTGGTETTIGTQGEWETVDGTETYDVNLTKVVALPGKEEGAQDVNLTNTNETDKNYGNALLLLPQTTTAWNPETEGGIATAEGASNTNNSYFLVDCIIYNVAAENGVVDKATDVCLWGKEEGGTWKPAELAIPVAFNWEQGEKYVYTFVFGNGNGGYEPGPNPDPVLVPITFEVSVDDFVLVTPDIKIESGLPESGE